MKIRIQNFGPIHEFEFDLNKDLHFIYGKNNIGKSYAISLVYLVLKGLAKELELSRIEAPERFKYQRIPQTVVFINRMDSLDKRIVGKKPPFVVTQEVAETIQDIFQNTFVKRLQQSMEHTFPRIDQLSNIHSDQPFLLTIQTSTLSLSLSVEGTSLIVKDLGLSDEFNLGLWKRRKTEDKYFWAIKSEEKVVYANILSSDNQDFRLDEAMFSVAEEVHRQYFQELEDHIDQLYFLPGSRSGLYEAMSIFSSIFARLSQVRHLINEKIDIPSLPEPTSDYFLNLSTIKPKPGNQKFVPFSEELEEIINGKVIFNEQTKKLEFLDRATDQTFDLTQTSSMIAEVAPIIAHLKFLLRPEDTMIQNFYMGFKEDQNPHLYTPVDTPLSKLLFIEEPEAHLHPEVQVKLMTFFAKLAQHGLKIVLTTHSNYLFNKLSNLLVAGEIEKDRVAVYHLIQTEQGSQLSPDNPLTDTGLEDNNFVPVAEQLLQERLQMYQQSEG